MATATGGVVSADAIDLGDRTENSGVGGSIPGFRRSPHGLPWRSWLHLCLTALSSEDPEQKALAASRVARRIPGRFCGIPLGGIHRSDSRTGRDDTDSRASFGLRVDCEATQMSSVLKSANSGRDRCRRPVGVHVEYAVARPGFLSEPPQRRSTGRGPRWQRVR